MHVVSFDIDGTLVASVGFDAELYAEAVREVLGVEIDTDWSRYENVTDSGILEEILDKHSSPDQRDRLAQEIGCKETRKLLISTFHALGLEIIKKGIIV